MSTYLIGDLQGCFDSLQALLSKIQFHPEKDQLGFVGDLINRGPKSLETLRFIRQLENPIIVLGNHDLHLLVLYYLKQKKHRPERKISHTLDAILEAPDCDALIQFLLKQPFVINTENFLMVHAGIPPQWSCEKAFQLSQEVEKIMRDNPAKFFENLFGNFPHAWNDHLEGWDRVRYIVNAFTRMRFCTQTGDLDLTNKTDISANPKFKPWFEWVMANKPIYFGHWASLEGRCNQPNIYALDTGCVWGATLTAIRLEDKKMFSVKAQE